MTPFISDREWALQRSLCRERPQCGYRRRGIGGQDNGPRTPAKVPSSTTQLRLATLHASSLGREEDAGSPAPNHLTDPR
eukprot:CAMPEP_0185256112 /NCGR_PEP_ID=MMETSP1359-20130426/5191_1 /TAXON_ID=552665 /ORGANISM="Bigelowiella longifila, Strain CCMP242" /LENGTH=78 /DNA_ID=CAMNT_0027840477 /DNA_START=400 /DNA_END=636 /DNA_ORIENTATION=-